MIYSKIIVSIPTVPKEIYRFIRVGDSLPLKELCEKIILCMNGSLKYGYCLTVNDRKYVSENFEEKEREILRQYEDLRKLSTASRK